jgi:putative transcriptional regulator
MRDLQGRSNRTRVGIADWLRGFYISADNRLAYVVRVLCAFLLLFAIAWPASAGDAKPPTAILIVARAELPDPNFKDATVLVMNNIASVPGGLIVNRPTRIPVSALFPEVERLGQLEDKVYFGGPVQIATVSFLFRADAPREDAIQVLDGVYLSTDAELLRKLLDREKPMEGLRIFMGYAGWGPGQLQAEIARGDWKLAPADPSAIFSAKPEHPWPEGPARGVGPRI